jgi:CO/xanthine dehydrogenase FAD-binding subunit
MSLSEFLVGPRQTRRRRDELVTALDIPARSARARSTFTKLGHRRYLVISVAMVAIAIDRDASGAIDYAGVVVGSCSATARHLGRLEARLLGQPRASALAALFEPDDLDVLTPIDDLRGTRDYRLDAVATLVRRALGEVSA